MRGGNTFEQRSRARIVKDYALVLNAGSSSLKFSVYHRPSAGTWMVDARGQIDGIGSSPRLAVADAAGRPLANDVLEPHTDARTAVKALAAWLRSRYMGSRVLGVGHRVVHGGAQHDGPTLVTPDVLAHLRSLIPLAPLHQPYNIAAIDAVSERLPDVPQVACFDTSFHRTVPEVASLIALPRELCRDGLQRYGFHGLSYEYIASVLPEVAPDVARRRVIVAHLGSGASLCALKDGKSVDHTLGFTALDGLCMATRPGAVDPGVILYLFQILGLSAKDVERVLYQKSGLLGISGISNDMRALLESHEPGARLAVEYFVYRATKEIGALTSVLGGVDAVIFTAGIGEHSAEIRRRIVAASAWLGLEIDAAANDAHGPRITTSASRVSAWVIPTNEELMIARHTARLLDLTQSAERTEREQIPVGR